MARDILPPTVIEALRGGQKIEAIKRLRGITGLGLAEAKAWVESYERGGPQAAPAYDDPPGRDPNAPFKLTPAALESLGRGDNTEAIRQIREATGVGQAEATDIARMIGAELPAVGAKPARAAAVRDNSPKLSPGQVAPAAGGVAKWIVLAAIVAAGAAAAIWF
jgi:ribosomal protein L7/L12